ncbi:MAG: galactose-1-phosphate uridylyltransferase [bacterium]|nr:galactose-1-phosphate uridylyltransferase [bacterium]
MSQFRQNPITKQWVLIAPSRAKRPEDFKTYSVMFGLLEVDLTCVFCPGNEDKNPDLCEDVCRVPNNPDWNLRVIQNKYHALEHTTMYQHREFYNSRSGYGDHEVIITRKHNEPVALQSAQLLESTLEMFVDRINTLGKDRNTAYVQVFHNHGRDAGASLVHPHYQILTTPMVPPHVHSEMAGCYHYYQIHKACIYCDIMKEETKLKERLVYEDEYFSVISAYASRSPFETWILPKRHSARFEDITQKERQHLAHVLKRVLGALYTKLSDPPLNFYIHTMPVARDKHTMHEEASYHWHLTVFPRLTIWAGFEYGTGIPVNPMAPEETAKFLRGDV